MISLFFFRCDVTALKLIACPFAQNNKPVSKQLSGAFDIDILQDYH
jgi:hypothetical protein